MLSNQKHVSTLTSYMGIINGIFPKLTFKKGTTNPDAMKIKYELVLNGMTRAVADEIEYNTVGECKTRDSNTPVYYIFQ